MKVEQVVYGGLTLIAVLYLYKILTADKMISSDFQGLEPFESSPGSVSTGSTPVAKPLMGVQASEDLGKNEISAPVSNLNRTPSSCFPQKILTANELLPKDDSAAISDFNQSYPIGEGIQRGIDYLSAGYHVGVNTVGQSLRNANRQLRAEPPNPQVSVSPWLNSTIGPDLERRPLDGINSCKSQ
jgi:hypothetical protein